MLDELLGGLQKSDMLVLAARPSLVIYVRF
ncbi:MAG: hypothetical protein Ct9H90mP2_07500 [Dehalococcoidia bacterium]|nr:MAG: hypothetical protein Ct9H90mP2_07500 [Dehalococcoidia bacterium]